MHGIHGLQLPHRHRPQVVTPACNGDAQCIARHALCSRLASRPISRTHPWITSSFLAGPSDAACHVPYATPGLPRICCRPPPVHLRHRIGTEPCAMCMRPVFRRILASVKRISSACAQVARLSHGSETPSGHGAPVAPDQVRRRNSGGTTMAALSARPELVEGARTRIPPKEPGITRATLGQCPRCHSCPGRITERRYGQI